MTRQNKKFKIYTHHFHSLRHTRESQDSKVDEPKKKSVFEKFFLACLAAIKFFYGLCYAVGLFLVTGAARLKFLLVNDIKKTIEAYKKRKSRIAGKDFKVSLAGFVGLALCFVLLFQSLHFAARALEVKNRLVGVSKQGASYLAGAQDALENKNFAEAESKFNLALESFTSGKAQIQEEHVLLNQILGATKIKRDADELFKAAALMSSAGADLSELYKKVDSISFGAAGFNFKDQENFKLSDLYEILNSSLSKLNSAAQALQKVDPNNIPGQYRDKLVLAQGNLDALKKSFSSFGDLAFLAARMTEGKKNIAVFFENNNELRATGGFIGTYGALKVTDGVINNITVSSIYDLDGQLQEAIQPPFPILNLSDKWYLRDANWFAHFPTSAKILSNFYEKVGGETPDTVIAMTPNLVTDLLGLFGPVTLPRYNTTLTADNFVEVTQVASSVHYDRTDNKPKQILADLVPVLLQKVSELNKEQVPVLLQILQNNLTNKQIVIYARDSQLQEKLELFNWAGQMASTDRDYLSVVGSNLNGSKSDRFMDQEISLISTVGENGWITNELTITRTNRMPKLDNTANESYLRVYVPAGSKLVSNSGFDYKEPIRLAHGLDFKKNPKVLEWESSIVKDLLSGTSIGLEDGKTFFGNWIKVEGGETKVIKLVYTLPFKLNDLDHYSLLVQKQIGAPNQKVSYQINFSDRRLLWKNIEAVKLETDKIDIDAVLNKDILFGMVMQKR